ncbi:hypothetical protein ABPG75_012012 [Micractinium tetrahymenae]
MQLACSGVMCARYADKWRWMVRAARIMLNIARSNKKRCLCYLRPSSFRLLRCIRLMHGEGRARLMPIADPACLAEWHNVTAAEAPLVQQQGDEAAASEAALAATRRCGNMGCINLEGASDAQLRTQRCGRCRLLRYCSAACSAADWRRHHACCRPPAEGE